MGLDLLSSIIILILHSSFQNEILHLHNYILHLSKIPSFPFFEVRLISVQDLGLVFGSVPCRCERCILATAAAWSREKDPNVFRHLTHGISAPVDRMISGVHASF